MMYVPICAIVGGFQAPEVAGLTGVFSAVTPEIVVKDEVARL